MADFKVCSGGQTGVDAAALAAAKSVGIATGGWMPLGWITLDGPKPEYLELYNMQEHPLKGYPARTEANVRDSDATLRIAKTFKSAGEKCTLRAIKWFSRPYLDVDVDSPLETCYVLDWLKNQNVKILNVAGNSERTAPGIELFAFDFLVKIFKSLQEGK